MWFGCAVRTFLATGRVTCQEMCPVLKEQKLQKVQAAHFRMKLKSLFPCVSQLSDVLFLHVLWS